MPSNRDLPLGVSCLVLLGILAWGPPPSQHGAAKEEVVQARQLRMRGDIEGAIDVLQRILERDPGQMDAHSELGLCYLRAARLGEARACFEKAIELDPEALEPYLNLAEVLSQTNEPGTARRILTWAIQTHPERAEPFYTMAKIQFRAGRLGSAEQAALRAQGLDHGKVPEVHALLANIYLAQGKQAEAANLLEAYLNRAPPGEQSERVRTRLNNLRQEMDRSAAPSATRYWDLIGRYQQGAFMESASALSGLPRHTIEAGIGKHPKQLSDTKRIAAALLHTQAALAIGNEPSFHFRKAIDFLKTIEDHRLRLFLERQWFLAMGYYYLGRYRFMVALPFLLEAVNLDPDDIDARLALGCAGEGTGLIRGHAGELQQAEKQYRKILDTDANHLEAHLRLGHVLKMRGEGKEALEHLNWVLGHTDRSEWLLLSNLLKGDVHRSRGELNRAIGFYREAVARHPGCQPAATALSHALHRAGDLSGSREVLKRFARQKESQPDENDVWWRYLQCGSERFETMMRKMKEELER